MTLYGHTTEAFFRLLKYAVLSQLVDRYPRIGGFSSLEKAGGESERKSRSKRGEPRVWVSFSFDGYHFWDLHLGIVLEKKSHEVIVGVHVSAELWPKLKEKVKGIPWGNYSILNPTYVTKEELNEHRFVEPAIPFDTRNIGMILQEVLDKTIAYYGAVSEGLK